MNHQRVTGIILGITFAFLFTIFLALLFIAIMEPEDMVSEDLINLLSGSIPGNLIVLVPGILSVIIAIILGMLWINTQKHIDLRYKMAFYLYHSKIKTDDTLPLGHLARVGVCSRPEIIRTLERMIESRELKGIVDRDRDIYIHKGLTRRTMRILTALPPARIKQLDTVKRYALEGAATYDRYDEGINELKPAEIEDISAASKNINIKDKRSVPCPECGKLNRQRDHFCTYCGEVIE